MPICLVAELVSVLHLGTPFIVLFVDGLFHGAHRFLITVTEDALAIAEADGA